MSPHFRYSITYKSSELGSDEEIPKDENGAELTADMPINKPVITSITIETFGEDYGEPETLEPFNYYNYLMQYYGSSLSESTFANPLWFLWNPKTDGWGCSISIRDAGKIKNRFL